MAPTDKWNWIQGKGTRARERYYFYYPALNAGPASHGQNTQFRDRADYCVKEKTFTFYFTIENDFTPDAPQLQKDGARFLKEKLHPSKYLFVATPTGMAKQSYRKGKFLTVIQYYAIVDNLPPEEFVSGLRQDLAALAQEEVEGGRKKSQVIDFDPWATGSRC